MAATNYEQVNTPQLTTEHTKEVKEKQKTYLLLTIAAQHPYYCRKGKRSCVQQRKQQLLAAARRRAAAPSGDTQQQHHSVHR